MLSLYYYCIIQNNYKLFESKIFKKVSDMLLTIFLGGITDYSKIKIIFASLLINTFDFLIEIVILFP